MVQKLVKLRGKYNPTGKRRKYPNLQWVTLKSGERIIACTKCIKALSKVKKQKQKTAPQSPAAKPQTPEVKPEKKEKPVEVKKEKPAKKAK
jgi:ribosomal protein L28